MATVKVRVWLNRVYEVFCDGTNEEECLDDIQNNELIDVDDFWDGLEFVSGEFDEPEPDSDSEFAPEDPNVAS